MIDPQDIDEAIDAAAGAEEEHERPRRRDSFAKIANAQPTARHRLRRQFLRLLENLPEDLTVSELREAIEE